MYGKNLNEAVRAWQQDAPYFTSRGVILHGVRSYLPENLDPEMVMDAQAALTTDPNNSVLNWLTTYVDPTVFEILFAPRKGAKILGENKKGDWLMETAAFPVVEHTGEVSSYGDYNNNGHTGANTNFPQRQSYSFQTIKDYGEREVARASLASVAWVAELDKACATVMSTYQNITYFFGVAGLQNYGLLNDPNLSSPLTPATKAAGGVKWITSGVVTATANEIYNDILSVYIKLQSQLNNLIDRETPMKLCLDAGTEAAMAATNAFGINVGELIKKNFPNMTIETAPQYGVTSATNPYGVAAGNLMQLIVKSVEGQDTGYCAFTEKMRTFPIIRGLSNYQQKVMGGTWGAIIRMPVAIASMVGM